MGKIVQPEEFRRGYREREVVFLAVPSHRGLLTAGLAFAFADAGMLSFTPGHRWGYMPCVVMAHRPVAYARNLCVQKFLDFPGARKLYFVDDDMLPPRNWWALLEHDAPVVSGFTLGWQASRPSEQRPPSPMYVSYWRKSDGKWESGPPPGWDRPYQADGVGAGCVVIDREVLQKIPPPWFEERYDAKDQHVLLGEDLVFFEKANALGYRVLVDPRVVFGHEKVVDAVDVGHYGFMSREEAIHVRQVAH